MWFYRGREYIKPDSVPKRHSLFVDRDFQVRYTTIFVVSAALGCIFVFVPIYYFMNQNYQIFVDLAYVHSPNIIDHLEKEKLWLNTLLIGASLALITFFFVFGFKITDQISAPLKILRNHLRLISRGYWSIPVIKVRENDEFQDIIESYNYFFSSFQNNMINDLEKIRAFSIDKSNRDAYLAWQALIDEKCRQLDLKEFKTLVDATDVATPDSRHAS